MIQTYFKNILKDGVLQSCRGRPHVVAKEGSGYFMLTTGTLTTSLYRACKSHPDNAQVQASVRDGLKHCKQYDSQTPEDVLDWLIKKHNEYHQGSGNESIVKFVEMVDSIDKAWRMHADEAGISCREGRGENTYNKRCWRWITEKYPNCLRTEQVFLTAKAGAAAIQCSISRSTRSMISSRLH